MGLDLTPAIRSLLCFLGALVANAATPHYDVKLIVDTQARLLHGKQSIRFEREPGTIRWEKQAGLTVSRHRSSSGSLTVGPSWVDLAIPKRGRHQVDFEYAAPATRGYRWLADEAGLFTAFHCEAWMICFTAPDQRATLRLELVVKEDGLRAVGPGVERRHWLDAEGHHWVFETPDPVHTFLFSFAIARLEVSKLDGFEIFASAPGRDAALRHTAAAAKFFREKTGVDALRHGYRQVFLPQRGRLGQEAAGLALMSQPTLDDIEGKNDILLMAHEMAHQWWAISVGIGSWSDFWLNEGFAEYASLLYLEQVQGREAFLRAIEGLETQLAELRAKGPERPLHFEGWKDATDALGRWPYVKGALFLHQLRLRVGDELFWRGIALYTKRHAGRLVGSSDFQRAFEEATRRDVSGLFDREVYGR